MTQTLQDALLKAGLISKDKLKKAEADKKTAERAARMAQKAPPPPKPHGKGPRRQERTLKPREETPKKKSLGFIEHKHHHHLRTECDACGKSSPDVEYYEHRNRSLDKYWLCVKCADNNNILDDFRQTMQSQFSQSRMFQRGYGPTKVFK